MADVERATAQHPAREFLAGVAFFGRGLRLWITHPRLMLIGAIPAVIVAAIYVVVIVVVAANVEGVAAWATPFADDWSEPWRTATTAAATLALLGVTILIAVYTFVAVTLLVGDPFYERIWRWVETADGGLPPEVPVPLWVSVLRSIRDALRILVLTGFVGLTLFGFGFVPVVGQTLVPVTGVLFGGWFLALELTGFAFEARSLSLADRRRVLGARRARTVGFGVACYLMFLVPFGAVIAMPAAVAGATLLSRDTVGACSNAPAGSAADAPGASEPRDDAGREQH
ncbi:EI24 domain-containing protein [Marisediminicola senii]|uniref:EI24 domain-containing protein n=1 Tax=Marisediminicola senii TaxID=2711233 RepID=UPI0013EA5C9A|nr:EI24 domain-containing protein [Marisediminicola senii]